jgi:uncharacterized protein YgiB involved in biofilm formation
MKRSTMLIVAVLGVGALILVLSLSRESKEEVLTYQSVEACTDAGVQDEATCQAEFDKAQALHEEVAPRYQTSSGCYSDYGHRRCYQPRSGSIWLPFMVGYMLAPRGGFGGIYSQPLYRPTRSPNEFSTAGGAGVGRVSADGRAQVSKSDVAQPTRARTRTVARGGFGRRSASAAG